MPQSPKAVGNQEEQQNTTTPTGEQQPNPGEQANPNPQPAPSRNMLSLFGFSPRAVVEFCVDERGPHLHVIDVDQGMLSMGILYGSRGLLLLIAISALAANLDLEDELKSEEENAPVQASDEQSEEKIASEEEEEVEESYEEEGEIEEQQEVGQSPSRSYEESLSGNESDEDEEEKEEEEEEEEASTSLRF